MKKNYAKKYAPLFIGILFIAFLLFSCSSDLKIKKKENAGSNSDTSARAATFLSRLASNIDENSQEISIAKQHGITEDFEGGKLTLDIVTIYGENSQLPRGYIISRGLYDSQGSSSVIAAYSLDGIGAYSIVTENGKIDESLLSRLKERIAAIANEDGGKPHVKADLIGIAEDSGFQGLFCVGFSGSLDGNFMNILGTAFDSKGSNFAMNESLFWTGDKAYSYSFFTRSTEYEVSRIAISDEADRLRNTILSRSRTFDEECRTAGDKLGNVFATSFRNVELTAGKAELEHYSGMLAKEKMEPFILFDSDEEVILKVDLYVVDNANYYYTLTIFGKESKTRKAGIAGYVFGDIESSSAYNDQTGKTFIRDNFTVDNFKNVLSSTGKGEVSYAASDSAFAALWNDRLFLLSQSTDYLHGFIFADRYPYSHANAGGTRIWAIPPKARIAILEWTKEIVNGR